MRIKENSGQILSLGFSYEKDENGRPKKTICQLFKMENEQDKKGILLAKGEAVCHENDQMRKSSGRKIALQRVLQTANFSREQRTSVWSQYLEKANV